MSWDRYIKEMSKPGTWCDNIIMQAVANALFCTIHITDSSANANATIIIPVKLPQMQRIVFLGYINGQHYVSTLPNTNKEIVDNKRKEMLAKKTVIGMQQRANETTHAKNRGSKSKLQM